MTKEAQKFISDKIRKLISEGYPQLQAVAIAYSMAREEGFKVPKKSNPYKNTGKYRVAVYDDGDVHEYNFTVNEIEEVLFDADMEILRAFTLNEESEDKREHYISLEYTLNDFYYVMFVYCKDYEEMLELGSYFLDVFDFKRSVLDEI